METTMYKKNALTFLLCLAIFCSILFCNAAEAAGRRIDATHILAREIELPAISEINAALSGVSYADVNPELTPRREKSLGQTEEFWIRNMASGQFERISAILRSIGRHCYVFVEDTQSVSQAAVSRVQRKFDETIYPVNTSIFGNEARPGIDNDNRIYLLMADIQDGYSNPDDGYVAGYFFAGDQVLQSVYPANGKVKSNEKEILYLDTYPCDPDADDYLEIVAHEFQHMIHYNKDREEVTWVNEGCSQIAPVFCGFTPPGHYKLLKDDPDRSLNNWAQWNPMPDYGQVYLWNQYIVDRLLPDNKSRAKFFRTLVGSKKKSIGGYIEALKGFDISFSNLFTDFSITNRINDPGLSDGRFSYKQKELKRFKLPHTRRVTSFPNKISDSVTIWGSDSYLCDIGQISSRLKISFSGYRRFLGPTHPFFRLAAILQDSTGIQKPEITFFKLDVNPADKNRLIGSIDIKCDGTYDSLTVVVMALAPEEVDDTKYMPASSFIYDLLFETTEPVSNVARSSNTLNINALVQAVSSTSDDYSESALRVREQYANLLIRTIKRDLERGSLMTVDNFIEAQGNQAILRPFARDISGLLLFFKNQQTSAISDEELQNRIDFLSDLR